MRVSSLERDEASQGYPISRTRLVLGLGSTVADLADQARAKLEANHQPGPERLALRLIDGQGRGDRSLFAASASTSAATTRRAEGELAADPRSRSREAEQRRNLEALLQHVSVSQPAVWQQAMHLAAELPPQQRDELFWAAAADSLRRGQTSLGLELLQELQRNGSQTAVTEAARLQLFWYLASQEASLHWPLPPNASVRQVAKFGQLQSEPGQVQAVTFDAPLDSNPAAALATPSAAAFPGAKVRSAADAQSLEERVKRARQIIEAIGADQPDLYFDPMLRFPLAALDQRQGKPEEAQRFWRSQLSGRTDPAYRSWAATELALAEHQEALSRPVWNCPRVTQAPRLDGQLNDAAWAAAPAIELRDPSLRLPAPQTEVRLAYDSRFLYLAATCEKTAATAYPSPTVRQRDQPLVGDRLELFLDIDRDAVTYWSLGIDSRGWVVDRLLEDVTWNPTWYLASDAGAETWTVEAAIPLGELSPDPVAPGSVWCVGLQRIIPGVAWPTWLQTAPVENQPAEFGLLMFR